MLADIRPDIYYIILDAYASSGVLREFYDYDNKELTDYLTDKGFYISSNSRSNYSTTVLSISSSLNMEYINSRNLSELYKMIDDSRVMRFLKSQGYKFIHFSSVEGKTQHNPNADIEFRERLLNDFSWMVLQTTMLRPFLKNFVQGDVRSAIIYTFKKMTEVPKIKEPTFTFAHILCPHQLTAEKGKYVFGGTYRDQFSYLNNEIEELTNAILAKSDTPPIIIFQGDHGPSVGEIIKQPAKEQIIKRMNILNAYYLPNGGSSLLYDSITPVNSFRLIFNHYLGADLELLEDRNYFGSYNDRHKFIDVTDVLSKNEVKNEI